MIGNNGIDYCAAKGDRILLENIKLEDGTIIKRCTIL